MIRHQDINFYIYEPTMLVDRSMCIPIRWFQCTTAEGSQRIERFYAKAWKMKAEVINGEYGWVVDDGLEIEICESNLLKNFPRLQRDHSTYDLPNPAHILGAIAFALMCKLSL